MVKPAVIIRTLLEMLLSLSAHAQDGWACVRDNQQTVLVEKFVIREQVLVDDESDFVRLAIPSVDPHSTDRALKIVENNKRDLLAVGTSDMFAQAGTYTGQLNRPWMFSVFVNKETGDARFISAGFVGEDGVATGRCTSLD